MESPTGIIPEPLMYPERKAEVLAYLSRLPIPGMNKVLIYQGWAITVGVHTRAGELQKLQATGLEEQPTVDLPPARGA